jgi:hypothetical protein
MQVQIARIGAGIVAVLFVLMVARTEGIAGTDEESCSTRSTNIQNGNAGSTVAICEADVGPPNRAIAHAKDQALAASGASDGSTAKSFASGVGAAAVADEAGGGISTANASGANAQAIAGGPSGATKAIARGIDSNAGAEIDGTAGGKADAIATGGSEATALIRSERSGIAVAKAKDASQAFSLVSTGGGKATSVSRGEGSSASADVVDGGVAKAIASDGASAVASAGPSINIRDAAAATKCKATAIGSGAGGIAQAACENPGSVVTAVASKGSTAIGSDTRAPTCTSVNGGVAKVRSPVGDCD